MKCQNCGNNEVNFKYTQVINGVKKEMELCSNCAKELGLEEMDFSIPISISSFLGDFFNYNTDSSFLPNFTETTAIKCNKCGNIFEDFIRTGELGCNNCYNIFEDRISPVLKNLHVSPIHIGKKYKTNNELEKQESIKNNSYKKENKQKEETALQKLQKDLQQAIKEEKYEEAAKIRDKIKELDQKK